MSVSHWGIFPGWYEMETNAIGSGGRAVFRAVDWHNFCAAIDNAETDLARRRRNFLDGK